MTQTTATGLSYSHRSFSQVNQLRTCGEAFRLQRIEKIPSRPSCAAVGGTIVHTATETIDYLIHEGMSDREELSAEADIAAQIAFDQVVARKSEHFPIGEWKRYGRATVAKPHGEDIEWFRTVGIPNCTAAYLDWRLAHPELHLADVPDWGPGVEVPYAVSIAGQETLGFIDRLFVDDGNVLYIMDIKSGQKPKTDEQLGTYRFALQAQYEMDVTYGGYLYALKTGEAKLTPPIDLSHWTEEKLAALYVESTRAIDAGIYIPHPGEACFHCGVSHACQFYQAAL